MKRHGKVPVRIVFLACIASVVFSLAACQPTPETPAVIGKDAGAAANAVPYDASEFPDAYKDSFSENGADVIFDAVVELPGAENLPTYEVSPATFSQDQVDVIINALFGDKQLYVPAKTTKADLEPSYVQALSDLKEAQEHPEQHENSVEYFQQRVDELKREIENAPDTDVPVPVERKLKPSPQQGTETFGGRGDLGKEKMASLVILNNTDSEYMGDNSLLWFENGNVYTDLSNIYPYIEDKGPANLSVTKEEAIAAAEDIVNRLGAGHMQYAACTTGILDSSDVRYSAEFDPNIPQSHLVYFTRNADGVQVTYDLRNSASVEDSYSMPAMCEKLTVAVDDSGVTYLRWQGPVKIEKAVAGSNGVIPFSDVMTLAKRQFCYLYATYDGQLPIPEQAQAQPASAINNGKTESNKVYIKRIRLGFMQVPIKDEDRIVLIPVWDFFGYYETVYENGAKDAHYKNNISLLTINAVNGNVIDREKGY